MCKRDTKTMIGRDIPGDCRQEKQGPFLAKTEFRAKSIEPVYIPYSTMITGTIHSKELWIPVQQINSPIIHEARMIGKWLWWRNWYQTSPLAINNHQTGQNILSNYVQALDNSREGQLMREISQTPQQLSDEGDVPATSPGGAQHYVKPRRPGSEYGAAGAAEIWGAQQHHRVRWWRDWRLCTVPWVLCEAGLCTLRAPHQVYQTVAATGLNRTDTRDQQFSQGQLGRSTKTVTTQCPLRCLASRMRVTPSGRARSRPTVTKRETGPSAFGSGSHHIRKAWEWTWAFHRPALPGHQTKPTQVQGESW